MTAQWEEKSRNPQNMDPSPILKTSIRPRHPVRAAHQRAYLGRAIADAAHTTIDLLRNDWDDPPLLRNGCSCSRPTSRLCRILLLESYCGIMISTSKA